MLDSSSIESQLYEASEKLKSAAGAIRKARQATQDQDALVKQTSILREAISLLVDGAQGLHAVIEDLEARTQYLNEQ